MGKTIALPRGYVALVDDSDYERINKHRWSVQVVRGGVVYACRSEYRDGKKRTVLMHREIIGAGPGQMVDHIDRDSLNNTRANLRFCTPRENQQNRGAWTRRAAVRPSAFKGVHWDKRRKKWRAEIVVSGQRRFLGRFIDEIEAARAYDKVAQECFGSFAVLNLDTSCHHSKAA